MRARDQIESEAAAAGVSPRVAHLEYDLIRGGTEGK